MGKQKMEWKEKSKENKKTRLERRKKKRTEKTRKNNDKKINRHACWPLQIKPFGGFCTTRSTTRTGSDLLPCPDYKYKRQIPLNTPISLNPLLTCLRRFFCRVLFYVSVMFFPPLFGKASYSFVCFRTYSMCRLRERVLLELRLYRVFLNYASLRHHTRLS
jgi:hypothetical protein